MAKLRLGSVIVARMIKTLFKYVGWLNGVKNLSLLYSQLYTPTTSHPKPESPMYCKQGSKQTCDLD
jgi:hypothetical protein